MPTTWKTIRLETAKSAVKAYNDGKYRGEPNPEVDRRARQTFEKGLGSTYEEILRQVEFIGKDYGGVAGQPGAISLARGIADDIFRNRAEYEKAATEAWPISQQIASRNTVDILYRPFIKPYRRSEKWQVWGSKFWHFLNPNTFPIADSRVNRFLDLYSWTNSVQMYLEVMNRFREFSVSHQEWLPHLRQVNQCSCPAWCDNKLWDKMCYGLGELKLLK